MNIRQKNRHILKKFRIRAVHDNMPYACTKRVTRYDLAELFKDFGFKEGAEIGVSKGVNSLALLQKYPDMKLYAVDPWMAYKLGRKSMRTQSQQERILRGAKARLEGFNVEFVRKTSMDALADFEDGSLDWVYIDGNHHFDYVAPDLVFWSKKVKRGGIVGLHDYCHFHWSGVIKAVDAYVYCHDIRPWFITKEAKPTVFWIKP